MSQEKLLSKAELIEFSRLNNWIFVGMMLFDWIVIAICISVSLRFPNWPVYIVSVIFIGGRMHGLGILAHEVAHYRFLKNRVLSEWIADIFLTWPLFFSVQSFRTMHLAHHKHLNSAEDPDFLKKRGVWVFPRTKFQMFKMVLGDLFWVNLPQTLFKNRILQDKFKNGSRFSLSKSLPKVLYYGGIAATLIYFGWMDEFLWYWIIPYTTWLHMIFKLRSVAEHHAIHDQNPEDQTRTVLLNYIERLIITPHHINIHIEHHLYPSVPFYKLLKLHKRLSLNPEYRKNNHFTHSFMGVLNECTQPAQSST